MRTLDSGIYDTLIAAPEDGLKERKLVTIYARPLNPDSGDAIQRFCFWNDIDTVTIPVLRGDTGSSENRVFTGDGSLLDVSPIVLTSDLSVTKAQVTLSQIHSTVQNMVRGFDIRGARVEIHRCLFNPQTHDIVGSAYCRFVGKVDKAPLGTPKVAEEGSVVIEVVSVMRELTRTNPAKKSDETQKRRSNDRFRRYANVANVRTWWGMEKAKASTAPEKPQREHPSYTRGGHR